MNLHAMIEAILFVNPDPVSLDKLAELTGVDLKLLAGAVEEMMGAASADRGIAVVKVAGGYQLRTRPELESLVSRALSARPAALSSAALETLAVIAYRQPVTRADIESVRGVRSDLAVATLLARGLIKPVGRQQTPGRPILYGTTPDFLEWCGLSSLQELPPLSEFERSEDDS